jgi:hypothetical protein
MSRARAITFTCRSRTGTAHNPLGQGVHLHWELPDFFRRGVQPSTGAELSFPHAPNRSLVTRYFSLYDAGRYGPVQTKSWIVESDFLSTGQEADAEGIIRPRVSVPCRPIQASDILTCGDQEF